MHAAHRHRSIWNVINNVICNPMVTFHLIFFYLGHGKEREERGTENLEGAEERNPKASISIWDARMVWD